MRTEIILPSIVVSSKCIQYKEKNLEKQKAGKFCQICAPQGQKCPRKTASYYSGFTISRMLPTLGSEPHGSSVPCFKSSSLNVFVLKGNSNKD